MNARTRRAALYAIGIIAVLASIDALAHSYTGLYAWALHHRLGGWQAMSWPAEIDVFLVLGELALYIAYLDSWSMLDRVWPWISAVVGLTVSVAGNIGHIQALPGSAVTVEDRLTAAASPVAAFAGLMIGFLVLKMTRQGSSTASGSTGQVIARWPMLPGGDEDTLPADAETGGLDQRLLADAVSIALDAAAKGQSISQRVLAKRLRNAATASQTRSCVTSLTRRTRAQTGPHNEAVEHDIALHRLWRSPLFAFRHAFSISTIEVRVGVGEEHDRAIC